MNKFFVVSVLFVLLFLIGGAFAEELVIETVSSAPVEQPNAPTGFFGLGEATDIGVGIVGILAVIAIVAIVWTKRK